MTLGLTATKKWTVEKYLRMAAAGLFDPDERVELIEGEILSMPAQNIAHWSAMVHCTSLLVKALDPPFLVGCQIDLELSEWSMPVPDFFVFPREKGGGITHRANWAELVLEVSDTSLAYDRRIKTSLYAKGKIPECWVLDVNRRQLIVHRGPGANSAAPLGYGYESVVVLSESEAVRPLCMPQVEFRIADML